MTISVEDAHAAITLATLKASRKLILEVQEKRYKRYPGETQMQNKIVKAIELLIRNWYGNQDEPLE